jgi:hypothetical protein
MRLIAATCMALAAVPAARAQQVVPSSPPNPRHYVCYRVDGSPTIDGYLIPGEYSGRSSDHVGEFVDIEGDVRPGPAWDTRVWMFWDDDYLYVVAWLEEPHVWATLTRRDAVVYHDNDLEVFIDPDGDTHDYYELEVNALGTVFDLLLEKPYRDGGPAVHEWDVEGLKVAVGIRGTLNDPSDLDTAWVVELALPWEVLKEYAPQRRRPRAGERWYVNFSRVQWDLDVVDGAYRKVTDHETGKPLPEHNWVWSPQHAVNMHMPEMWGIVQFSGLSRAASSGETFVPPEDEEVRWALRLVYYAQREYRERTGRYAAGMRELDLELESLRLETADDGYVASLTGLGGTWYIRQDGKIWRE